MALSKPLGWLLLVVPAFALPAESLGVLAVGEPPGPSPELIELTQQLTSALAERTSGVLPASQLRVRMTGQTSTASLAELDRAYAGALATQQVGDFDGAGRTLKAVIDDLEKLPDSSEAFAQWQRAMLRLARIEQTIGQRYEAKATLERLVRADPTVKVDPTQYPPSFEKQVNEVRAEAKAASIRTLSVSANAKGVKVFVQGREVGTAPVTVSLPPGRYRVSGVRGPDRIPAVPADLTSENQEVRLDVSLAEALRPGGGPGLALAGSGQERRIITTAAWLGLDRVCISSLVSDGDVTFLSGQLYDVRRGMLQREGRLRLEAGRAAPVGGIAALVTFLMTGQPSDLVTVRGEPVAAAPAKAAPPPPEVAAAPPAPALRPSQPPDTVLPQAEVKRSGRSNALGWTAVGAGVVAVGLGVFAVVKGMDASSNYDAASNVARASPGASGVYQGYVNQGDASRDTAMVLGVGAGVAAGTSVVLAILSYKQTGTIGPFRF